MSYAFVDPAHTTIRTPDGRYVPANADNRDYADLLAGNVTIADYVAPPPTADQVRAEARRRMRVMFSARDDGHLDILIANASREAIRLLRIKADRAWTTPEATRAAELEAADAAIEAIRAASNAMEPNPPADFADDSRWP